MIETIITFLQTYLVPLGGIGVFLASFIEEVVAPIPSAIIMTAAGFFFLQGDFSIAFFQKLLFVVVFPGALGVTLGSLLIFFIAYISGRPAIERWGKWFALSWQDVEKAQEKFAHTKADEVTLFIFRTIPIIPSVAISAFCGLIRMNLPKYLLISFLGTLIRATLLALVGWQVGALYYVYAGIINRFENVFWAILTAGLVLFFVWNIQKKKGFRTRENVLE